jgi:hypothetical protein
LALQITEEQISKWPPDAQAVVRFLLANISELEKRLEQFDGPKTGTCLAAYGHLAKTLLGTQSAKGSRFVERALTVIETCRLRKSNVFA